MREKIVFERLRGSIRSAALSAPTLSAALEAGRFLGYINWRNNSGVYCDEDLEESLFKRFEMEINNCSRSLPSGPKISFLHIVSKASVPGGHTRLLMKLADGLNEMNISQMIAVVFEAPTSFKDDCAKNGVLVNCLTGSLCEKLFSIVAAGLAADHIVFHIHPDDIGSAIAARALKNLGKNVLFVNHADHVFSYGIGAASTVLEVSGWGWEITKRHRSFEQQSFLGIPIDGIVSKKGVLKSADVVSIGNSYKYKPVIESTSFPNFLLNFLPRTTINFRLIGPSGDEPWWSEVKSQFPDRLKFCGPLSFEDTRKELSAAFAYVDSFPVPGGTAFTDAVAAGIPVFGPSFNSGGYSLADELRSSSIKEMADTLVDFINNPSLLIPQYVIQNRISTEFNARAVSNRLLSAARGEHVDVPASLTSYSLSEESYIEMWSMNGKKVERLEPCPNLPLKSRILIARHLLSSSINRKFGKKRLARWVLSGSPLVFSPGI